MAKPQPTPEKEPREEEEESFYEAMPMAGTGYRFHDVEPADTEIQTEAEASDRDRLTIDETKTTAIVTLILTALVAIGLALLIWRGLDTIKGVNPSQTNSSGSLEL
jgi:hypothetical protein